MKSVARLSAALALAGGVLLSAGQIQLPEPAKAFGTSVTGAFEGWFDNPDGSRSFLVGYLNRNRARAVDVPIGPNNQIDPGGPDMGQPTHFLPGRQSGMFIVTVPKDFTPQQRLTWTITVNAQTTSIPLRLRPDYNISPFRIQHDVTLVNTPPVLRFDESEQGVRGPAATATKPLLTRTVLVSMPLSLAFWTEDDGKYSSGTNAPIRNLPPPVRLTWSKYRGPGSVTFDKDKPQVETLVGGGVNEQFRGKGATTATFSEPGEYMLHVTANDYSGEGGGGEQCCWTTAIVKVSVTR
ncbi:MAG: hypothetical protein HYZ58_12760 [Acidobacteria bacterium]|nr:hypothetical protein [Acidobacteriota bacterium]